MIATLNGQSVTLLRRLVHTNDNTAEFEADHVMGRDFAKKAYVLLADDDNGRAYRIVFYGNSPATAKKDVLERGFINVRGITEHDSVTTIRNLP